MNDETMMILNMLDQGKINSDEAERLLEAINPSPYRRKPRPPKMPKDLMKNIERIPQIVSEKLSKMDIEKHIEDARRQIFDDDKRKFEGADKITINQMSGDIKISGVDEDLVLFRNKSQQQKAVRRGRAIAFQSTSGDIDMIAPQMANIAIQNMSGDITAKNIAGKCRFNSYSGDIDMAIVGGNIKGNVYSGDINVRAIESFAGKINSYSGDIVLELAEGLNMALVVEIQDGNFHNQTDFQSTERSDRHIIKIGSAENTLKIKVLDGDVEMKMIENLEELVESLHTDVDEYIDEAQEEPQGKMKVKIKANIEDDCEEAIIITDED
ncbi:MAG: DUF4097 family beta strand repeat-containing protein [Candidatus Zixiibacteriota bacterium]